VVAPLRELLGLTAADLSQVFQFAPDGGSPSGLLRSLGPSIEAIDGAGSLPVWRRGSTTASLFRIAEALALSSGGTQILAIDDLGDGLDAASAAHLAFVMRRFAGQAWLTTRVSSVAEVFDPQEIVRLGREAGGARFVRQGRQPTTKAETVASKHWHRNLLPALCYRAVVVVEGPNDFAALHTLALRLSKERGYPLPATRGVSIINAGSGGSGGYAAVLKLAGAAREMGLRAVGIVDGDTRDEAQQHLQTYGALPDTVVRLPDTVAIEGALVSGLPDDVLRQAIRDAAVSASLPEPASLDQLSGPKLASAAIPFVKRNSLHGPFIDALPEPFLPPLATQLLSGAVEAANGKTTGIVQL
jgi:putative ATP-dependent endonuclease of OLD family